MSARDYDDDDDDYSNDGEKAYRLAVERHDPRVVAFDARVAQAVSDGMCGNFAHCERELPRRSRLKELRYGPVRYCSERCLKQALASRAALVEEPRPIVLPRARAAPAQVRERGGHGNDDDDDDDDRGDGPDLMSLHAIAAAELERFEAAQLEEEEDKDASSRPGPRHDGDDDVDDAWPFALADRTERSEWLREARAELPAHLVVQDVALQWASAASQTFLREGRAPLPPRAADAESTNHAHEHEERPRFLQGVRARAVTDRRRAVLGLLLPHVAPALDALCVDRVCLDRVERRVREAVLLFELERQVPSLSRPQTRLLLLGVLRCLSAHALREDLALAQFGRAVRDWAGFAERHLEETAQVLSEPNT